MADDLVKLQRDLRNLKREFVRAANRANETVAKDAVKVAKFYSSGTWSSAAIARAGHLYATRHTGGIMPYGDPAVINRQSGVFQASWLYTNLTLANGLVIHVVKNVAPYAKFLETGTHTMIPRPIDRLIREHIYRAGPPVFLREFEAAFRRAIA